MGTQEVADLWLEVAFHQRQQSRSSAHIQMNSRRLALGSAMQSGRRQASEGEALGECVWLTRYNVNRSMLFITSRHSATSSSEPDRGRDCMAQTRSCRRSAWGCS
jgi:hypothetical protein